jgi:multiple sugar transport system substrate-binding protein
MMKSTRRTFLEGAGALGLLAGSGLPEWAKAWAQNAPWKPEKGAQLTLLRWKRFIQAEEDAFMAIVAAFTKATGVKVTIVNESLDDVQPKASVAANTGSGPDMFWGLYSLPHLFPNKCADVTDVADYLGKKYGGWVPSAVAYGKSGGKWIDIPVAYNGNVLNYRKSSMEKAGFKEFPKTTDEFLAFTKAMKG